MAFPVSQGEQTEAGVEENLPGLQMRQESRVIELIDPGEQAVHSREPAVEKLPGSQLVQDEEPAPANLPAMHVAHDDDLNEPECLPSGHIVQVSKDVVTLLNLPASQLVQYRAPTTPLTVPEAQSEQMPVFSDSK